MNSLPSVDIGAAEEAAPEIDELMSLIGVAPRDFDAVRVNYLKLPAGEVTGRLAKFRRSREVMRDKFMQSPKTTGLSIPDRGHPRIPFEQRHLTTANILEALARLENVVSDFRPELLIGVNSEGMKVGNFIRRHLGLSAPILRASGTALTGIKINAGALHRNAPVIGVIGHAAKTGETLVEVMNRAKMTFNTENVFATILVASEDAALSFNERAVYYHQITESFSDSLTESAINRLADGDPDSTHTISANQTETLDVVRQEMARLYPTTI